MSLRVAVRSVAPANLTFSESTVPPKRRLAATCTMPLPCLSLRVHSSAEVESTSAADAEQPRVQRKPSVEEHPPDDLVHRVVAPDVLPSEEERPVRGEEAGGVQAARAREAGRAHGDRQRAAVDPELERLLDRDLVGEAGVLHDGVETSSPDLGATGHAAHDRGRDASASTCSSSSRASRARRTFPCRHPLEEHASGRGVCSVDGDYSRHVSTPPPGAPPATVRAQLAAPAVAIRAPGRRRPLPSSARRSRSGGRGWCRRRRSSVSP